MHILWPLKTSNYVSRKLQLRIGGCSWSNSLLARAVVNTPKPCHTIPILYSLHSHKITISLNASNTNSCHLLTKSSQPSNFHIYLTSSLFNFLAELTLHLSSPLLSHRHNPRYE